MKKLTLLICTILITLLMNAQPKKSEQAALQTPVAKKYSKVLEMHGDKRQDDYYWMNDYWLKGPRSEEVVKYLTEENDYYAASMKHTDAFQKKLYDEMIARIKQADESVPYFKSGYWYLTRTEQGKEYAQYLRKKGTLEATDEMLIDANVMGKNYKFFALGGLSVSPDNKLLAYSIDTVSRRKYGIFFKDLTTGKVIPDVIPGTSGGITWANDNKTVFYTLINDVTLRSEKIMKHKLGTSTDKDELVYFEKDETYNTGVGKTKSEEYIVITSSSTLSSETRFLKADDPNGEFKVFYPRQSDLLYRIDHYQDNFYVITNWNAKNFRLMKTPVSKTSQENWSEVIPHRPDVLLQSMAIFNNFLVLSERKNALTHLRVITWKDKSEHYLDFGEPAYVAGISTNPEFNTDVLRFSYQSMTTPPSTFDYNMKEKSKKLMKQTEVLGGYDAMEYQTERVWATAKDGTKIPVITTTNNLIAHNNHTSEWAAFIVA